MNEDEHLEADYEDRYQNDDSYDDVWDAIEDEEFERSERFYGEQDDMLYGDE